MPERSDTQRPCLFTIIIGVIYIWKYRMVFFCDNGFQQQWVGKLGVA